MHYSLDAHFMCKIAITYFTTLALVCKNEILATLCKTNRVYLVFELCDYIHIAAGQLEVHKKLVNDSQNQYHSW